jgi:tetratricopeptide (TPR) repeat protein
VDRAGRTIDTISDPYGYGRAKALSYVASTEAKVGNWRSVDRAVNEALKAVDVLPENGWLTKIDYMIGIARAQAAAGDRRFQTTLWRASRLAKFADSMSDVAVEQASLGDVSGARITFERALREAKSRDSLQIETFIRIANGQSQAGDRSGAKRTIAFARRVLESNSDVNRLEQIYWLANAQAKAGDHVAAQQTFAYELEQVNRFLGPKERAYRRSRMLACLASVQVTMGDSNAAAQSIQQAIAEAKDVSGERADGVWSDITYAQASVGNVAGALDALRRITEEWRINDTLSYVAEAQLRAGDVKGALETGDRIKEMDYLRKDLTYNRVVKAQISRGEITAAKDTLRRFHSEQGRSWALRDIAGAITETESPEVAVEFVESGFSPVERTIALLGIAETLYERTHVLGKTTDRYQRDIRLFGFDTE